MLKNFTLLKVPFQSFLLTAIVCFSFSYTAIAQAPYCGPIHRSADCQRFGFWIDQVSISEQYGNNIYTKNGDLCNQSANPNYTLISSTPSFTLVGGTAYTITFDNLAGVNQKNIGIWIDLNGDNAYTGTDEFIGNIQSPGTGVGTSRVSESLNFSLPCNYKVGTTRMRIRTDFTRTWQPGNACLSTFYGETEEYTIKLDPSTKPNVNFTFPSTIYIGTVAKFANTNPGYMSHTWSIQNSTYTDIDAEHIFSTAGTYDVKLVSENCFGKDSVTKQVTVITPPGPPVPNFVLTKNVVELLEETQLIDLSTNGPTTWDWYVTNGTDTINGQSGIQPDLSGSNPYVNQNPALLTGNFNGFVGVGTWDVCLKASNSIQVSNPTTFCRPDYLIVRKTSFNIDPGTNTLPEGIITAPSGTIYDNGGTDDYTSTGVNGLRALIAPCGATSVTINFTTFDVGNNANLFVFDGASPETGIALHPSGGFSNGNSPTTLTANSGALFMQWVTSGGGSPGFVANWTSVDGASTTPTADFTTPGATMYNGVFGDFINTSLNAEGNTKFEWTITDPSGSPIPSSFTKDLLNQAFTSVGPYTISLKVTSCDGIVSTKTKQFIVANPTSPTQLDFTADNQRPAAGEDVTFTAISDKANRWEWSFFPPIGIDPVAPVSDKLNQRSFTFNQPGVYAVQLRGFNTIDTAISEATVVKTAYIQVVEHCTPRIGLVTSTDVAISKVSLLDPVTGDIYENESTPGDEYTDYSDLGTLPLNYGGTYVVEVSRLSNINTMSRKIWIDWNVDGDFDDEGENIWSEPTGNSLTWTDTIVVPDASKAFSSNTVMRIGVSFENDANEPCGANSDPNANRIGEFEDYAIQVVNDGDNPTITLNGSDTVYIEQGATPAYVSLGATANDPSQGDISANIASSTDVDQSLPGVYYEIYNAKDASGNSAKEVTRVVYVVADQTAPVISIVGASDTTIEVGTPWIDLGATADDNKEGNITSAIVTSGSVDHNILGIYTLTYSVNDNQGNAASEQRIVRVVDTQLPIIENANADKTNDCWTVAVQLQNIFADVTTAMDNYNSLGNNLTFTANPASPQGGAAVDTRFPGTTSVTYTATDESGNVSTQCINYVVKDFVPPVIDLRTLDVVYHPVNNPYTPVAATASDNLYSSTEVSIVLTSSNVDPFTLGTYQDVYTATDAAGNTSTKTRTVIVIDGENPVISGKNGRIVKVGVGSSVYAVNYINFSDNYDNPSTLFANHKVIYNDLNLQEAGLYTVRFTTTDNSGNESEPYSLIFDVQYRYEVKTGSVSNLSIQDMLNVSPNPTNGPVNISVNLPENEEITLAVFNSMGQQIELVENAKIQNGTYTINLNDQVNGIYYVKMNIKGNIVTKKVLLNK